MKKSIRSAVFALATVGVLSLSSSAFADPVEFNAKQTEAIQKIVKEYLISNPEIMFEVQDALQRKQMAQKNEALSSALPSFYKSP